MELGFIVHRGFGFGFGTTWRSPAKNHTPTYLLLSSPISPAKNHISSLYATWDFGGSGSYRRQQQQRAASIFIYPLPS